MSASSAIEWTEATWNPIVGCSKVSAGCKHCYAERMASRLVAIARAAENAGRNPGRTQNYVGTINRHGHWSGKLILDYSALEQPKQWKSPKTIFVNSMSDLFQEGVPLDFIQAVFEVMNSCPQHTFQVLTKRPHLAAKFAQKLTWTSNIWIGTSVEDARYTGRIKHLQKIPGAVRFLSIEPLLGAISKLPLSGINWVIVGGESGPGARPMKKEWVRQIRDRCIAQGIPFFFKQWGGVSKKKFGRVLDGKTWDEMPLEKDLPLYAKA